MVRTELRKDLLQTVSSSGHNRDVAHEPAVAVSDKAEPVEIAA